MTERETFDTVAQNVAEVIDEILSAPRSRARRIELITHHVRRSITHGYRAAKTNYVNQDALSGQDRRMKNLG
jgi:hypothetical protein